MPSRAEGSVNLRYGAYHRAESFNVVLDTLTAGAKNFVSSDMRVDDTAAGEALSLGKIGNTDVGLILIKNICAQGDLHVDINYVTSWTSDLIIPPGGVNLITPNVTDNTSGEGSYQSVPKCKTPLGALTSIGVATIATNGAITFDTGVNVPCTATIVRTSSAGGTGSGTSIYIVQVSSANTGTVYELDGSTAVDLATATGEFYTSTTVVTITPFIDVRYTITEE